MTLQTTFADLHKRLDLLLKTLNNLWWAVVEAQPPEEKGHALVGRLDGEIEEVRGLTQAAVLISGEGRQHSTQRPFDGPTVRQSLLECHATYLKAAKLMTEQLFSVANIENLNSLAREQPDTWEAWVQGVLDALENCVEPALAIQAALLTCWEALTEKDGQSLLSVKAISTGQNITLKRRP